MKDEVQWRSYETRIYVTSAGYWVRLDIDMMGRLYRPGTNDGKYRMCVERLDWTDLATAQKALENIAAMDNLDLLHTREARQ